MALNPSGQISLAGSTAGESIAAELSLGPTTTITLNDTTVRTLAAVPSGAIAMPTDFWGKSTGPVGTAYWAIYAGYHYRPSPATSMGYYSTYDVNMAWTMITNNNDILTIGNQNAYLAPAWSTNEIKMIKFNSSGIYQSQYNWGNNYPNRNGLTMNGAAYFHDRSKYAINASRGQGNPLGAYPTLAYYDSSSLSRTGYYTQWPSPNVNTVSWYPSTLTYSPNSSVLCTSTASPAPLTNFAYLIVTSGGGFIARRLPTQTGASIAGTYTLPTYDNSNNYYMVNVNSPTTTYNWWKADSSGNITGQTTISSTIASSSAIRTDTNPTTGTTYVLNRSPGTGGLLLMAIDTSGSVLWSTQLSEPSGVSVAYNAGAPYYDRTNNKLIVILRCSIHPIDGVCMYFLWINPSTGAITLQRVLKGLSTHMPSVTTDDVFNDRIAVQATNGVWNTGVNNPAPRGGTQLVINPNIVLSLPAPGGALGTGVGYQNALTYAATTNFSNSPYSATPSPNGLAGWTAPAAGPINILGYEPSTDYGFGLTANGTW
jgi:hypothetical protein